MNSAICCLPPLYVSHPVAVSRPEILFNLPVSGTPAHFFIYHIYPIVDFFGGAASVKRNEVYEGLRENGQYDRFVNTLVVEFKRGGIGQWTWAGGIAINAAEEHERYVLTEGTISDAGGEWHCTTPAGVTPLSIPDSPQPTLQELWFSEIRDAAESAALFGGRRGCAGGSPYQPFVWRIRSGMMRIFCFQRLN